MIHLIENPLPVIVKATPWLQLFLSTSTCARFMPCMNRAGWFGGYACMRLREVRHSCFFTVNWIPTPLFPCLYGRQAERMVLYISAAFPFELNLQDQSQLHKTTCPPPLQVQLFPLTETTMSDTTSTTTFSDPAHLDFERSRRSPDQNNRERLTNSRITLIKVYITKVNPDEVRPVPWLMAWEANSRSAAPPGWLCIDHCGCRSPPAWLAPTSLAFLRNSSPCLGRLQIHAFDGQASTGPACPPIQVKS